jgi:predicted patatin/cPLA2 family phospholipase
VTHAVLELLSARQASGSRADGARLALVIEGGGNRAAYSAGMAIAIEELGLTECFDAVYGTSGGALNGAWLLTGEGRKWLPLWASPEYAAERVVDPKRLLRGGPMVDVETLLHHVYVNVFPMDFEAVLASPVSLHPMATDARTGEAVDLRPTIHDRRSLQAALRASASLPLLAGRPVRIEGGRYVDGGLVAPVPFRAALEQGATHVLVLRTRRAGQAVEQAEGLQRLVMEAWFGAFARGAAAPFRRRHELHLEDEAILHGAAPSVLQVRPPLDSPDVSRLTSDLGLVARAIELGREELLGVMQDHERSAGAPL